MLNATEGLKELREGNRRYADGLQRTGRLHGELMERTGVDHTVRTLHHARCDTEVP